jgi:hypothetical protein
MKTIILATALALAVSAPALAKPADTMHHARMSHHAMNAHPAFVMPDAAGVYVDGREIGRDPDANIRATLRDESYEQQNGG